MKRKKTVQINLLILKTISRKLIFFVRESIATIRKFVNLPSSNVNIWRTNMRKQSIENFVFSYYIVNRKFQIFWDFQFKPFKEILSKCDHTYFHIL